MKDTGINALSFFGMFFTVNLFSFFSSLGTSLFQAVQKHNTNQPISHRANKTIQAFLIIPAALLLFLESTGFFFIDSWILRTLLFTFGITLIVGYAITFFNRQRKWHLIFKICLIFAKLIIFFHCVFVSLVMSVLVGRTWQLPLFVALLLLVMNSLPYLISFLSAHNICFISKQSEAKSGQSDRR